MPARTALIPPALTQAHHRPPSAGRLLTAMLAATLALTAPARSADGKNPRVAPASFEEMLRSGIAPMAGKQVAGFKVLHISSDVGPWQDSGMTLAPGDRLTLVLAGRQWLSRAYNLYFDAPVATWCQVGSGGRIFRGEEVTNTVNVVEAGSLRCKTYPTSRWLDEKGTYAGEPAAMNPDAGGGVDIAAIRWAPDADIERSLGSVEAAWAGAELTRLRSLPPPLPEGWSALWEIGSSRMFQERQSPDGAGAPQRAIALHMRNDVAILRKDVAIDLKPGTMLHWAWKVDRLPASTAEDQAPTHDYMSIAVEFDNGQDLTFLWSHELPVGTIFRCPLPGWSDRETHVVTRSGTQDLGHWLREGHDIGALYARAIGGQAPARIVRVWLIGVSLFGHGEGASQFGDITLSNEDQSIKVY